MGDTIEVSGTSATAEDGSVIAPGDAYEQAAHILTEIGAALIKLGATLEDVTRTRVFLTDIDQWRQVARAHQEAFGATMPASSFVGIAALMLPELVVEIEATAIVAPRRGVPG